MEKVYALLTAKDTKEALAKFNQLQTECLNEPIFADKLEQFLPALKTEASCGRGRTFKFFMINDRWDTQGVIEKHLEDILGVLDDSKAPVVRQCIPYLTYLAKAKPKTIPHIRHKLENLTLDHYKESMQSLIQRDIEKILPTLII